MQQRRDIERRRLERKRNGASMMEVDTSRQTHPVRQSGSDGDVFVREVNARHAAAIRRGQMAGGAAKAAAEVEQVYRRCQRKLGG
jgi:hypothetical protein